MPVLLLLLFSIALSIGMGIIVLVIRRAQSKKLVPRLVPFPAAPCGGVLERVSIFQRPTCWLAVRSRSLAAVQAALGLHNPKPCSWAEGVTGDEKLFIAPPIKGWIFVVGTGLPDPSDDVDICFRFLTVMSRKLGQVQFFSANRILYHHAWVQAEGGKIRRAYAWAGRTLWQQGSPTQAEKELELKCFEYAETAERASFGQPDHVCLNIDKVPLLAARWSLDPARIEERFLESICGVAGQPSRRY
jgi:hypothetical protein